MDAPGQIIFDYANVAIRSFTAVFFYWPYLATFPAHYLVGFSMLLLFVLYPDGLAFIVLSSLGATLNLIQGLELYT